jgi:protein transport protein SEC61 subunit alpha
MITCSEQGARYGVGGLQAFRGFAGTSILILVGVATDTARRVKAEQSFSKYKNIDRLYDELKL